VRNDVSRVARNSPVSQGSPLPKEKLNRKPRQFGMEPVALVRKLGFVMICGCMRMLRMILNLEELWSWEWRVPISFARMICSGRLGGLAWTCIMSQFLGGAADWEWGYVCDTDMDYYIM
jgi:hypothetical protein